MRYTLMLALLASSVSAQDFVPSILVDHTSGPAPLLVTIDMCASTGRELRFGWDYDGDGIDDQRGPCRRTVTLDKPGAHAIRVAVWENVGAGGGRREETVWTNASETVRFRPVVRVNRTHAYLDDGLIVFDTCGTEGPEPIISSFDLTGDGVDDQSGAECYAKIEISVPARILARITVSSGAARHVEYREIVIEDGPRP